MNTDLVCPKCGEAIEISEAFEKKFKDQISETLQKKYQDQLASEKQALEEEIKFKNKKLDEVREQALAMQKEKLVLEDEKKSFELEKQRQLSEERDKIRQQVLLESSEAHRLKDLEKEKMINDLKKSLTEAQIKANQGSQQLQGEVQELDLETVLQSSFPHDLIEPVDKGVRGADIAHTVRTSRGTVCGVILWESKRTKSWVDDWAVKLKDDLRAAKANIPVIITTILPKEIKTGFGLYEGVWVAEPKFFVPLAEVLRKNLIDVAREKHNNEDKGTKAEMIYSYLTSDSFTQQVQSILEVHQNMFTQIQKERSAFEKIWKEREAQAQRIISSTASIYGSIQGLAGQSLPNLPLLSIEG